MDYTADENNVPAMTWVTGKQLVVPDAISRRPDLMEMEALPQDGIRLETGGLVVQIRRRRPRRIGVTSEPAEGRVCATGRAAASAEGDHPASG